MKTNTLLSVMKALVLSLLLSIEAEATTVTLYPSQDMWLDNRNNPYSQNGNFIEIGGNGFNAIGLWQFDFGSIPNDATITSAALYLAPHPTLNNITNKVSSASFWIMNTPWNESNSYISNLMGQNLGSIPLSPVYGVAVWITDIVEIWKACPNYGFALVPNQMNNYYFYFPSREYGSVGYYSQLVVNYGPFKLGFPAKSSSGVVLSPYTTTVTSLLDLDQTSVTSPNTPPKMRLGNGQTASTVSNLSTPKTSTSIAVTKMILDNGESLKVPPNFMKYVYEASTNKVIAYDNHDGYDFGGVAGGTFIAPFRGKIFIGSAYTTIGSHPVDDGIPGNAKLWRNPSFVSPHTKYDSWKDYHGIYIDHGNGYISYAFHCSALDPKIQADIEGHGYSIVMKGQVIGTIGGFSGGKQNGVPIHLHFGIFKGTTLVDPYGTWTGKDVLWDINP